jgi:hypothetical protein
MKQKMEKEMIKKTWAFLATVLSAVVILPNLVFAAPTVTSGHDPAATLSAAVRYRNLNSGGGAEVQIGAPGFPTGTSTGDVIWASGKCIQFNYDGVGTLTTKIANIATPCVFTTPLATITKNIGSLGTLNYLEINITKNGSTNSVALNGVSLGSDSLGNFSISGSAGTKNWKVTDINLTDGFTFSGTINLVGLSGGGDSNFVEIDIGSVVPPDTEGPVTSNVAVLPVPVLLNGEATVRALVDDSSTGNNAIQSAFFNLNAGTFSSMTAEDGAFDEVAEDVEATFTATTIGVNEVCVYGKDSLGNAGSPTCQEFLVTYKFDGFYSPVENDFLNVAKAGQAIPAKWRLTDANDVPISDPASFVNLYSYSLSCTDLAGDINDSVEEYASGSSGLQYLGDGYWQFNWKTPKTYVNTCRAMYVEFNSGANSPVVKFKFK